MGAPWHNLLSKNDRALVAFIIAGGAGTANDTFPAKTSREKETFPTTYCFSQSGTGEDFPYSGTYNIKAKIQVQTMAAVNKDQDPSEPRLNSEERVAKTFDLFHNDVDSAADKLAADITAAARALAAADPDNHADLADYTCQDVKLVSVEQDVEGDCWVDTLNLEMVSCPSNVS
jgi:hypothetical protein